MSNDLILSPSYDVEQYPKLSSVIAKSVGTIVASVKSLNVALNLFQKVYGMVEAYAFNGEQMANFVRQSGLAADKFQALANASKRYGGSAESTAKSLTNLRTGLADIQKGGNGNGLADTLKAFNINPKGIQSTEQFLTVIAGRMETLKSETEKLDFGRALGLDDATIKALSGGIEAYTKNLKDASKYEAFSPEDMKRAEELEQALRDIGSGLVKIGSVISQLLLPVLVPVFKVIKGIVDFFASHAEAIKFAIIGIIGLLATSLIPGIALISGSFAPIIAAIILISFLLEQLFAWISGKSTIFGDWLIDFETFKEGMISGFKQLVQKGINLLTGLWNAIKTGFGKLVEFIRAVVAKVLEFIPDWLLNFIKDGGTIGLLFKVAGKGIKALKNAAAANGIGFVPFDGYMAELHKGEAVLDKSEAGLWRDLIAGKETINLTANVPIASVPQGAITNAYNAANTSNSITLGDITIQTQATDAEGIANDLVQSIKMAFNGLDTGVRA